MPCVASSGASEVYIYVEHADRSDRGKPSRLLCICILLAFSRSSFATEHFQRKPHIVSDLHCRWVGRIACETNKHSRSEIKSNRHTHTHTHAYTDPTTVALAAHACRGLIRTRHTNGKIKVHGLYNTIPKIFYVILNASLIFPCISIGA